MRTWFSEKVRSRNFERLSELTKFKTFEFNRFVGFFQRK